MKQTLLAAGVVTAIAAGMGALFALPAPSTQPIEKNEAAAVTGAPAGGRLKRLASTGTASRPTSMTGPSGPAATKPSRKFIAGAPMKKPNSRE